MHDLLFENQARLSRANLIEDARLLGLNLASFQRALDQHTYRPVVERDLVEANGLGVTSTPAFFINGRRLVGPQGPDVLQAVVDSVRDALPKNRSDAIVSSNPAPAIRLEHAPAKGPAAAPVSIVEFSDFECSYCAQILPVIRQVLAAHPAQIRFSFKHYPLPLHKQSQLAHEAAAAAGDQGKFWEMHDLIFAGGDKLGRDVLIGYAKRLNLDLPRFSKDLDSHRFKAAVESDRQEGDRLGVDAAPFFFVNGHAVSGAIGLADFEKLIGAALKETAPPRAK
jgi:protein-disulfide isomerase